MRTGQENRQLDHRIATLMIELNIGVTCAYSYESKRFDSYYSKNPNLLAAV